jgi:hypothetical protein
MSSQLWHRHSAKIPNIDLGWMSGLLWHRQSAKVSNIELGWMSCLLWHRHSALVPNIELGQMSSQLWHRHQEKVPYIGLGRMSSQLWHRHCAKIPNIELGRMPIQLWHRHSTLFPNIHLGRMSSWNECRASSGIDIRQSPVYFFYINGRLCCGGRGCIVIPSLCILWLETCFSYDITKTFAGENIQLIFNYGMFIWCYFIYVLSVVIICNLTGVEGMRIRDLTSFKWG